MSPESKPTPSTNDPKRDEERAIPSQGPLKNEPTPEKAQEQKQKQQGWEQKKSGAV